jgi:amidophosphoribosyltransferase
MCGVIGIISREPVSGRLISGSERLQNRGERSVRIVTYDREKNLFFQNGGLKPPSLQFFDFNPNNAPGCSGIAHTRYATVGDLDPASLSRNIQPVLTDRPGMATCSNGDLVNHHSLMQKLRDNGFSFDTQVDAKVTQHILIKHLINSKFYQAEKIDEFIDTLFGSVQSTMNELVGAYSALCLMEKGLLAFKDPHGIRPLCYAHRENSKGEIIEWAFASESTVFNYFGDYHGITEVEPGEAVFVSNENLDKVFKKRLVKSREAFCFFEFCYFARPDSLFKGKYVEVVRRKMGRVLAEEYSHLKDQVDTVCGLPGTAITTGLSFAHQLGLPYHQAIIKVGNKRSFQETSCNKRQKAIDDKFIFIRDFIEGKRVAIVDDSNVRGTTSKKIIKRLHSLGAKEVRFLFYTPEIVGPCFYGIDTPDENLLIANNRSNEEIRKEMGCKGVHYISHDGLIRGLDIRKEELCMACLTKDYPTDVAEAVQRVKHRRIERDCLEETEEILPFS